MDALPVSKKMVKELARKIEEALIRIDRCTYQWCKLVVGHVGKVQANLRNTSQKLDTNLQSLEKLLQKCKNHLKFTPFLKLYKNIRKSDMRCQLLKHKRMRVGSDLRCKEIEYQMIEKDEITAELKEKFARTCKTLNDKTNNMNSKYRDHRKQWRCYINIAIAMSQTKWFPEVVILDAIFFRQLQNGLYAYGGVLSEQKLFLLKYFVYCVFNN